MPKFREIVLHIGYFKTGTTSVQTALETCSEALAAQVVFTTAPQDHDLRLAFEEAPLCWHGRYLEHGAASEADYPEIRARIRRQWAARLEALPEAHFDRWIVSSEHLFDLSEPSLRALKNFLSPFTETFRIVFYIREHVATAISMRSTAARFGEPVSDDLLDYLSPYDGIIARWEAVFGRAAMQVRIFERDSLQGRDILTDFFCALGIALPCTATVGETNARINEFGIAVLRRINTQMPKISGFTLNPMNDYIGWLFSEFARDGAQFIPSEATVAAMIAAHAAGDETVRHAYFPERATLFRAYQVPRAKGGNDPAPRADLADQVAAVITALARQTRDDNLALRLEAARAETDRLRLELAEVTAERTRSYRHRLSTHLRACTARLTGAP